MYKRQKCALKRTIGDEFTSSSVRLTPSRFVVTDVNGLLTTTTLITQIANSINIDSLIVDNNANISGNLTVLGNLSASNIVTAESLESIQNDITSLQNITSDIQISISSINNQIEDIEEEFENLQAYVDTQDQQLQSSITTLETNLTNDLQTLQTNTSTELNTLRNDIDSLQAVAITDLSPITLSPSNERVGILTSSPADNLHVNGTSRFDGLLRLNNNLIASNATRRIAIGTATPACSLDIRDANTSEGDGSSIFILKQTGNNDGIDGNFNGYHEEVNYMRFTGGGVGGSVNSISAGFSLSAAQPGATGSSHPGRFNIKCNNGVNANNSFGSLPDRTIATFRGDGRVGINTIDPLDALHVIGATRLDTTLAWGPTTSNNWKNLLVSGREQFIRFRRGGNPAENCGIQYSDHDSHSWYNFATSGNLRWTYFPGTSTTVGDYGQTRMELNQNGNIHLNVMPGFNTAGSLIFGRADATDRNHHVRANNGDNGGSNSLIFQMHTGENLGERTDTMCVNGSGRVGIATNGPRERLHVWNGNIEASVLPNASNQRGQLRLSTTGTVATSAYRYVDFAHITNSVGSFRLGIILNNNGTNANTEVEALTILQGNGRVGIGTISPAAQLHVAGISHAERIGVGFTSDPAGVLDVSNNSDVPLSDNSNNDSYQLVIGRHNLNSGQGAGIAFYTYLSNTAGGPSASEKAASPGAAIVHERTGGFSRGHLHFKTREGTTQASPCITRMTITDTGRVGIGEDSPLSQFEITSAATNLFRMTSTSNSNKRFEIRSEFSVYNLGTYTSASDVDLYAGGVAIATLKSGNGRLGIGTINPQRQLQLSTGEAAKASGTAWEVLSDARFKNDIIEADYERCYDIVKGLPLRRYAFRKDVPKERRPRPPQPPRDPPQPPRGPPSDENENEETMEEEKEEEEKEEFIDFGPDEHELGWIAQEVETVFPKSVRIDTMYGLENARSLQADQLIKAMYGCIKQLITKVEALELRISQISSH